MSLISYSVTKAHTASRMVEVELEPASLEGVGHEAGWGTVEELEANTAFTKPSTPGITGHRILPGELGLDRQLMLTRGAYSEVLRDRV